MPAPAPPSSWGGDLSSGSPSLIMGGRTTTTGDGQILNKKSIYSGGTIELPSTGQFVLPDGGRVSLSNGVELVVGSESQLDFDPTATVDATRFSLQINGNHTLKSASDNEDDAIFRLLGAPVSIEPLQSLIISGTTLFNAFADLHFVGGTFTTGALIGAGSSSSDLILAIGTFNLTSSDLELGFGTPFGVELQGGTTDINVTNGDVNTLVNGVLSTNGT